VLFRVDLQSLRGAGSTIPSHGEMVDIWLAISLPMKRLARGGEARVVKQLVHAVRLLDWAPSCHEPGHQQTAPRGRLKERGRFGEAKTWQIM
jgi:hypothetical protein